METIAKHAGTSRPVLYRRWPSLADLSVAAIRHHLAVHPIKMEDLGSIRAEMISFFHQTVERGTAVPTLLIQIQQRHGDKTSSIEQLRAAIFSSESNQLDEIIQRGIERGEVNPKRLTRRVVNVVSDLVRHDAFMHLEQPSRETITEIVEEVFLPLVRCDRSHKRSRRYELSRS